MYHVLVRTSAINRESGENPEQPRCCKSLPASMLAGDSLSLLCNLIARMPGFEGALPVNSVTALVGAPVVMWVLFNKRKSEI